ncbi:hypothetical protein RJ641_002960 [Dillenia turbinata]|uniref:Uncharacterized protein n=1 Tax=Dillenia turbinata TaxID=194707 RepID=A0AAN8VPS0_9MAGN
MPPFLPPHLVILIVSLFLVISAAVAHSCSSSKHTLCPPFTSTPPPFPFSSTPGCGHPAFQIQCSSPHSTISISNVSFSLLHFQPNSTSLILSPQLYPSPSHQNCSSSKFITIPTRPINLSNSPFKVSDSSCSRLSLLRPCPPPNLPNCSLCSWDCKLIKAPVNLIHTCENQNYHRQVSEQGCQGDILGYLDNFLRKFGIQVEWGADQDDYFTSCSDCRAKKGVCGFNSSDPGKPFLCFHTQSSISPKWIQMGLLNRAVDISLIVDGVAMDGVDSMAELAFRCVAAEKDDRPDSREIVDELKHIRSRIRGGCGVVRASSSSNAAIVPDPIKVGCVIGDHCECEVIVKNYYCLLGSKMGKIEDSDMRM